MASRGAQPTIIRPSAEMHLGADSPSKSSDSFGNNALHPNQEERSRQNSTPSNHGCFVLMDAAVETTEIETREIGTTVETARDLELAPEAADAVEETGLEETLLQQSLMTGVSNVQTQTIRTGIIQQEPAISSSASSSSASSSSGISPNNSSKTFSTQNPSRTIRHATSSTRAKSTTAPTRVPRLRGLKGIWQALGVISLSSDPNLLYREARYNRSSLDRFVSTLARRLSILRANLISQMIPTSILMALSRRQRLRKRREELRRKMLEKKAKEKQKSPPEKTEAPVKGPAIKRT